MKDPCTIDEWSGRRIDAIDRYNNQTVPFAAYDDPDSHSPLASLAARKSIRRGVDWALLAMITLLLLGLAHWWWIVG